MTAATILIEKIEGRNGWYRMTITSMKGDIGETKIELLLRAETVRQFRNEADRAISNQPRPNLELKIED